jgi:hypothetical protein
MKEEVCVGGILDFGCLVAKLYLFVTKGHTGLGDGDTLVLNARGFGLIPGCVSVSGDVSDPRVEGLHTPFAHRPAQIVPSTDNRLPF